MPHGCCFFHSSQNRGGWVWGGRADSPEIRAWESLSDAIIGASEKAPLACAICETRKEKRFCLAVHGRICPVCCGTEREVTLDCPAECPYLQQARRHEASREPVGAELMKLFPQVRLAEDLPHRLEPLIMELGFALARAAHGQPALYDRDLMAALTALATSYETLVGSGLVYDAPTANLAHQAVIDGLQRSIAGYRETERRQIGYSRLRDSELLQVIVFLLRLAAARTSGRPRSRAFIDLLSEQFPQHEGVIASPGDPSSRIILP